jgi:hypothetical protein
MRRCKLLTGALLGLLIAAAGRDLAADEYTIPAEARDHWAWKPPARPVVPRVRAAGWVRNPIDAFILAKLEAAGLAPAAPAGREQLLRRVTFEARVAHQAPEVQRTPRQKEVVAQTARLLVVSPQQVLASLSAADKARHQAFQQELKTFDAHKPAALPSAPALQESKTAPKTFVLRRGEMKHPGAEVAPGWPVILLPGHRPAPAPVKPLAASTGRRDRKVLPVLGGPL